MKKIILGLLLIASILCGAQAQATVSNGTNQVIYNGDGVTSIFPFSFNVYNTASENDLLVSELNTTTGAVTNLTINTNYTVSLTHSTPSPGSVTLTAGALASGIQLSILRQLPLTQLVTESDNSATPASVRNNVYDRNVMVSQQLQQQLTRAVLQNIFATTSITLPAAVANLGLCWDSTATSLTNCAVLTGTIGVPIANSNLQTLTAAGLVNGSSLFGSGTLTSLTATNLVTTGNVGIGTPAPSSARLVVSGGNVGIGTPTPGALFIVNGGNVGIGTHVAGNAVVVSGTVQATSFTGNAGSGLFGSFVSKSVTTVYQAASDGIVVAIGGPSDVNSTFTGLTDSSNPPTTIVAAFDQPDTAGVGGSITFPVRKGDFYEITVVRFTASNIYFISLGS